MQSYLTENPRSIFDSLVELAPSFMIGMLRFLRETVGVSGSIQQITAGTLAGAIEIHGLRFLHR